MSKRTLEQNKIDYEWALDQLNKCKRNGDTQGCYSMENDLAGLEEEYFTLNLENEREKKEKK